MTDFNQAPYIVATSPKDNAEEVSADLRQFSVTFNTDLDRNQIENNVSMQSKDGIRLPVRIAYDKKVITFTLVDGHSLKAGTIYSISVKGDEDLGDGLTTGVRTVFGKPMEKSFAIYFQTKGAKAPEAPKGVMPVHLNAIKGRPTFEWSDTGAMRYEVEVAKDNLFDRIHWANQYATSPATPSLATEFPDGRYNWRVRGIGEGEIAGDWSPTYVFAVDSLDLGPVAPGDTLPPEIEYDELDADEYVEFLDTFPVHQASNVKTTLKTLSFRVLGEVTEADIDFSLTGESVFGEEADHGEVACEIKAVPGNGFTTVYVTLPIWA